MLFLIGAIWIIGIPATVVTVAWGLAVWRERRGLTPSDRPTDQHPPHRAGAGPAIGSYRPLLPHK